jgi:small subunit ribosomal protein S7
VPRKGNVPKRELLPDPIYNDKIVTKLINYVMLDGKKRSSTKDSIRRF